MQATILSAATLLAALAQAQNSGNDINPAVDIVPCSNVSCVDLSAGICQADSVRANGVGIAPEVLKGPNDSRLSLTIVDDGQTGGVSSGFNLSTQTLYLGVPPNLDTTSAGCALAFQYEGQTLPVPDRSDTNTTTCDGVLPTACQDTLTTIVQQYARPGTSNSTAFGLSHCESLAAFVHSRLTPEASFCNLRSNALNITGGTTFGSGADSSDISLQNSGCQPVQPQEYQLRRVATMNQVLERGSGGAGRAGVTPVLSVLYGEEEDAQPAVQYACMRSFTPEGAYLPDELNFPAGEGSAAGFGIGTMVVVVPLAAAWGLLI